MELCNDCQCFAEKRFLLLCKEHSICRKCLVIRAQNRPNEVMQCRNSPHNESIRMALTDSEVKQTADISSSDCHEASNVEGGMWIFVDDSKIWTEAKRLQSVRKGFLTTEDHRLRIDMGKLATIIAKDRHVKKGILYAAEPPPIHEVWQNIESKAGWDIDHSRLKVKSPNEKQINAKLVSKATATAILTPFNERTTMAFVTGDANVLPALEKVVKETWNVEIYMWRDAIHDDICKFAEKNDQVNIYPLDDHLDFISFHRYELDIHLKEIGSNIKEWQRRRQPMYSGVVFEMHPRAFPNRILSSEWIEKLEKITKWPFQYYWFLDTDQTKTNNLVVTFRKDAGVGFDLANFLLNDSLKTLPNVVNIKTYHEFIGKEYCEERDEELEKIEEALGVRQPSPDTSISVASDSDNSSVGTTGGFRSTSRKPKKKSKQLYSTPCKYKKNCKYGTSCYSHHTKDEIDYFRKRRGGRGNPRRKTTLCPYFLNGRCLKHKEECENAHGEDDAWCPKCICEGHLQENCPNKK